MSERLKTRAIHGVTGLIEDRICPFCMTRSLEITTHYCTTCKLYMDDHFAKAVQVYSERLEQIIERAESKGLEIPHTLLPTRTEAYQEMLSILRTILFSCWPGAVPADWAQRIQSAVRNAERAQNGPEQYVRLVSATPTSLKYRLSTPKGKMNLEINPETGQLQLYWDEDEKRTAEIRRVK